MDTNGILIFENTRLVIKAETILHKSGFAPKVIPVPKSISSECGMCLLIRKDMLLKASEVLEMEGLAFKTAEL